MHPRTHVRLVKAAYAVVVGHPSVMANVSPVPSRSGTATTVAETPAPLLEAILGAHLLGRIEAVDEVGLEGRLERWTESRKSEGLPLLRGDERDAAFLSDMVTANPVVVETPFAKEAVCVAARTIASIAYAKATQEAAFQDRPVDMTFEEVERAASMEGARAVGIMEMRAGETLSKVYARAMKRTFGSLDAARAAMTPATDFAGFSGLVAQCGMAFGQLDAMKGAFPVNLDGVEIPLIAYAGEAWARSVEEAWDFPAPTAASTFGL